MKPGDDDFAHLKQVARDSLLDRLAGSSVACAGIAWTESWMGRQAARLREADRRQTAEARTRVVALVIASAGLWTLLLLRFEPRYVTPAIPRALIAEISLMALAVAALAGAFARAWSGSLLARAFRWSRPASRPEATPATGPSTS